MFNQYILDYEKPGNSFSSPFAKEISFNWAQSFFLLPLTIRSHESPPTQLCYLCCPLPSVKRSRPGSAFNFLYSFYTLLPWKFHPLPCIQLSELFRGLFPLQVYISNSDLSSRLLTLVSNHLTSPPGLDPKQKHPPPPAPNMFPLYSYNCYWFVILETKLLFIFLPPFLSWLRLDSIESNRISKSQWLQQGSLILSHVEVWWHLV